jgi:N-acetylmuramoyl-L-alanine amidase
MQLSIREGEEVKRIIALGIIFANLAFLGLLFYPSTNSSTEIKKAEFEPIEKEIKPSKEIDAQEIMDKLVRESKDERIQGFEITYDEAQMLMKIAMAEAGGDGVEGKAMVMAVILNRVEDDRFPDSIKGVIFQEHEFSPITDGRYYNAEPDVECHLALAEIEMGEYYTIDALYFENADKSWQQSNCEYLGTVGHHRFYKN